jgi:DUF4097 and DUF4098 domain-containing protein YvlB
MIRPALLILLFAASTAVAVAAPTDISKVNGSIRAEAGGNYGELSAVNGAIRIEDGAVVREADTVNGTITVQARAQVGKASTVNGSIDLGAGAVIENSASTVNGAIRLAQGAEVSGGVETVNGSIRMDAARIGGDIETVNGSIIVGDGSQVGGGITVRKPKGGWFNFGSNSKPPRVEIGANAVVQGELRFEREVELVVHPTAKIGRVIGDVVSDGAVERR